MSSGKMASDPRLEAYRFSVENIRASHHAARRHAQQLFDSNLTRIAAFMDEWDRLKERATYPERYSRQSFHQANGQDRLQY
jgi:hypothetical protein